jgi:beta-lactamase class A
MKADKSDREREVTINISGKKVIAFLIIITLWILSLWGMWYWTNKNSFSSVEAESAKLYPLINPRLRNLTQEKREKLAFSTLIPLRDKLFDTLHDRKENTAFYVEDLNSGSWLGWEEKTEVIPASLLKITIAMAVMKKLDDKDWELDDSLTVKLEYKDKSFGKLWQIPDGTTRTVDELLDEMLKRSDNTASKTLFFNLSSEEKDNVFNHIGLVNPEGSAYENMEDSFYRLTPRNLASMFRSLYNGLYLTRESSNILLEKMADTEFDNLVATSIPSEIKISHKIAAFADPNIAKYQNYHDCGIAYAPDHPYLFCLITKNMDSKEAEKTIVEMSGIIYDFFSKNHQQ